MSLESRHAVALFSDSSDEVPLRAAEKKKRKEARVVPQAFTRDRQGATLAARARWTEQKASR